MILRPALLAAAAFLLSTAVPSAAADLALVVFPDHGALAVDASVVGYAGPSVVESVHEGLRAEVRFNIQVYRDETGLSGLLGDSLLGDYRPHHLGQWDPFQRMYTVERHDGSLVAVPERDRYIEEFFTLHDYRIPAGVFQSGRDYYLLGRAAVVPISLVPALSILSIFADRQIEYTAWVRFSIPADIIEALASAEGATTQ